MYCLNCGTKLPDDASFCWKCGKPQRPDAQPKEVKRETCEIAVGMPATLYNVAFPVFGYTRRIVAKAIGPQGPYIAAQTKFVRLNNKQFDELRDTLITELVQDGWEPLGGNLFHRRLKS
jgi:hypothetical protein